MNPPAKTLGTLMDTHPSALWAPERPRSHMLIHQPRREVLQAKYSTSTFQQVSKMEAFADSKVAHDRPGVCFFGESAVYTL